MDGLTDRRKHGPKRGETLRPGTYILVLKTERPLRLQIGALGAFEFPAGYYLYVGSALNGLERRLERHLRREKRTHWHIDYLRRHAEVVEVWYTVSEQRLECRWAAVAQALPGARLPVPGFGASDCGCPAHLVYFPTRPDRASFQGRIDHPLLTLRPE